MSDNTAFVAPKPGVLTRLFFRFPPLLYKVHLGWILDHRVLYLVHTGRKTGKIRRNCIEVIHYDRVQKESIVISAYGKKADWFRNISKNSPLELRIGREAFLPEFRVLQVEEARTILKAFYKEHQGEAKFFLKQFFHLETTEDGFVGLAEMVPLVAFRPKDGGRRL